MISLTCSLSAQGAN